MACISIAVSHIQSLINSDADEQQQEMSLSQERKVSQETDSSDSSEDYAFSRKDTGYWMLRAMNAESKLSELKKEQDALDCIHSSRHATASMSREYLFSLDGMESKRESGEEKRAESEEESGSSFDTKSIRDKWSQQLYQFDKKYYNNRQKSRNNDSSIEEAELLVKKYLKMNDPFTYKATSKVEAKDLMKNLRIVV